MARISPLALALVLSGLHASAFTLAPSSDRRASSSPVARTCQSPADTSRSAAATAFRSRPLFLSSTESKPSNSLRRLPESAVELTLRIPPAATKASYDKTLNEVSKNVSIPGFRKGAKIPPAVIENAWAKQGGKRALRTMAINDLCEQLIQPALKDDYDLEPVGQPTLVTPADALAEGFVPGEDLEVVIKCDVWPEISWKDVEGKEKPYVGLTGKYKRKPFDQARFDAALRDLTERYARLEPYSDESQVLTTGDACNVNMVGYLADADGGKGEKLPDAASGDNVEVILGTGRYMEGLVEGIEGGKVGETRTVKVRFPDALRNKDLAGKDAIFDVTILSASRRILPEVTDEFAAQVRPGLTADGLRDELKKAVDTQDAQEYAGARNEVLGKALSEVMDVDVPDTLVTNQAREKYALMMTDMRDNGMADEEIKKLISPENFEKYKDICKADIVRDFKISMAVDEIARLESIQVPGYQIDEQIQSLKDQAAKEGQDTSEMDNEQMRRKVESTLERRMVYDFLAEVADLEVEYVEEEFDEALMEKLAAESLAREEAEENAEGEVAVAEEPQAAVEEPPEAAAEEPAQAEATIEPEPAQPEAESVIGDGPASSKDEDVDLTSQVIMNFMNSQEDEEGIVDDDEDDDDE